MWWWWWWWWRAFGRRKGLSFRGNGANDTLLSRADLYKWGMAGLCIKWEGRETCVRGREGDKGVKIYKKRILVEIR